MATRRPRSPRGAGQSLRADLVAAAVEVLRERGDPAAVTVRGVAARVGVSPNAVYLHFADRDALLVAAVVERFGAFVAEVEGVRAGDGSPVEQLRAAHAAFMAFADREPGVYRTMFGGRSLDAAGDELNDQLAVAALPAYEVMRTIVERCIADGTLPPLGANALTRLIFVAEHGWADMAGTPRGAILPSPDDILDTILGLATPR